MRLLAKPVRSGFIPPGPFLVPKRIIIILLISLFSASLGQNMGHPELEGKVLFGYQGWFDCPDGDGDRWRHDKVEMYPDFREMNKSDLCEYHNYTIGGEPAYFYSALNANVIMKHFEWMRDYNLDGILVQRFVNAIDMKQDRGDIVLKNIMRASSETGVAFALEYDAGRFDERKIKNDWEYLVDKVKLTEHPNYVHHKGRPLVSIWGPGVRERGIGAGGPLSLQAWFQDEASERHRASYMAGTGTNFRTGDGDASGGEDYQRYHRQSDAVQPWSVGRYKDTNQVKTTVVDRWTLDNAWVEQNQGLVMPVIFPGFAWSKKNNAPRNQIPRIGGRFIWAQALAAIQAGVKAIKIAMFDEVDEATAMFKISPNASMSPDQGYWLNLDADGEDLPSDWYLRVAACVTAVLRGDITVPPEGMALPISPDTDIKDDECQKALVFYPLQNQGPIHGTGDIEKEAVIYSLKGERVGTIKLSTLLSRWNGLDDSGNRLEEGMYVIRYYNGGSAASKKVMVW